MSCLLQMRALRDSFSANERRIADFILENSQLMRDYSSQQLASAVNVSQSSIVKFSQKLGYKGYPDLKMAINESVVIEQTNNANLASVKQDATAKSSFLSTTNRIVTEALEFFDSTANQTELEKAAVLFEQSNKIVFLANNNFHPLLTSLNDRLLDDGKLSRIVNMQSHSQIDVVNRLEEGDLLLVIDTADVASLYVSAINSIARKGASIVHLNLMGSASLHGVSQFQIEWVNTGSDTVINQCQTQVCLSILFVSLELQLDHRLKLQS